ncbi:type 1 glutamine amidotransferase domain-containing protein [Actinomycetospora flava]|uniref:Type 1 glutamine amidotransferase domain-containing protein n=1 Tax=Actinomycetospora flava TaxID=3129232 RepID=A0ABU8M7Y2_9PSEU
MAENNQLQGKTIMFLCAKEGTEQVELTEPWKAVEEAGGTPVLVSETPGSIQAFNHLDKGDRFDVDAVITQVKIENYDGLVLPGGVANPDLLRTIPDVVQVVGQFFANRKPVAAICHAPWTLIEADVVRGRRLTSFPSLATDLRNAGAEWVDEEVVVDQGLVTSRNPDDLPAFCRTLVEEFANAPTPAHALSGDQA